MANNTAAKTTCTGCGKPIRGRVVVHRQYKDRKYHPVCWNREYCPEANPKAVRSGR